MAKCQAVLFNPTTTKSKRKQIAVAIARHFSIDWWRVRTQRCQAQDLGLALKPVLAPLRLTPLAKKKTPKA